jgi:hypothetical protein
LVRGKRNRDGLIKQLPTFLQKEDAGRIARGKFSVDGGGLKNEVNPTLYFLLAVKRDAT